MSLADADLTCDGFLDGRLRLWQPRTRLSRRDRPGAARGLRAGPARRARARARLRRRDRRALPRGPGARARAARARAAARLRRARPPQRRGERHRRSRCTRATCAARRPRSARSPSTRCSPTRRSTRPAATGAADPGRDAAHREGEAALADWIDAGLRRLRPGGRLTPDPPDGAARRDPRRPRRPRRRRRDRCRWPAAPGVRPSACWCGRARAAARRWSLHPPFTLHEGSSHNRDGESYTEAAQRVLRGMEALSPGSPPGGG